MAARNEPADRRIRVNITRVITQSAAGELALSRAQAFWWRLGDNLFRRLGWYVIPVVVFGVIGVVQAGNTLELYQSAGRLSASANPLVPNPTGAAAAPELYETPADALARLINERLRTDEFVMGVAETAGLGGALDSGAIELDQIRSSLWAAAGGSSILDVVAQWNDPESSFQLAMATIDRFYQFLRDTVGADATEAVEYYTDRLDQLDEQRQAVEVEYDQYVSTLPPVEEGQEPSFEAQVRIDRLQAQLDTVNIAIAAAEEDLDDAQLTLFQLDSDVGQTFQVVDPPVPATEPESTSGERLATIGSFTMLGVAASVAVLLISTMTDRSINAPGELLGLRGVGLVATVSPPRRWRFRSAGSK